jgi:uncharacterized protein YndB with AHSA1/START domain
VRLGDDDGTVVVSVLVPVAADEAWAAVTRPARVAMWWGELSTEALTAQERTRLEFGDGDFFDIDVCDIDPAKRRLHWKWRFLGTGAREDIEIHVAPEREHAAIVTVRDCEPRRSREASLALGEGWRDFTSRLQLYLATGDRTRYDWRGDVDVWIELPATAEYASRILIPAASRWLPLDHGENLFTAGALVLGEDRLVIDAVQPAGERSVRFTARPADLRQTTTCEIAILSLGTEALLGINHSGFRELDAPDAQRRAYRERCLQLWLSAVGRANAFLLGRLSVQTRAAARDAA